MSMRHPLGDVTDKSSQLPRRTSLQSYPSLGEAALRLDTGSVAAFGTNGLRLTQNLSYTDCLWLRDALDKHIAETAQFAGREHDNDTDERFAAGLRKQMEAQDGAQ